LYGCPTQAVTSQASSFNVLRTIEDICDKLTQHAYDPKHCVLYIKVLLSKSLD